jgi:hypothetical protein
LGKFALPLSEVIMQDSVQHRELQRFPMYIGGKVHQPNGGE